MLLLFCFWVQTIKWVNENLTTQPEEPNCVHVFVGNDNMVWICYRVNLPLCGLAALGQSGRALSQHIIMSCQHVLQCKWGGHHGSKHNNPFSSPWVCGVIHPLRSFKLYLVFEVPLYVLLSHTYSIICTHNFHDFSCWKEYSRLKG